MSILMALLSRMAAEYHNEINIKNIRIFSSLFRIEERLLVGKKPPDEITDNARFSDIKDLNSKML